MAFELFGRKGEVASGSVSNPDLRSLDYLMHEGRMTVDAALASRILSEALYERQRPVVQSHVALLANDMRRKRWTSGSQICFARKKGRLFLVNGQHRLYAVIEARCDIEFQVLIEDVDTDAEIAALYYRFDVNARARSLSEVLSATDVADKAGVSKSMALNVYKAVALISNRFQRIAYQVDPVGARSIDERLEACKHWWASARVLEAEIQTARPALKKKLMKSGVLAVALVTFRYQPEKAAEFWSQVASQDGLKRGDPRQTLAVSLSDRRTDAAVVNEGAKLASLAWNAWFEQRQLKILKIYDASQVAVLGTPFDGRRAK